MLWFSLFAKWDRGRYEPVRNVTHSAEPAPVPVARHRGKGLDRVRPDAGGGVREPACGGERGILDGGSGMVEKPLRRFVRAAAVFGRELSRCVSFRRSRSGCSNSFPAATSRNSAKRPSQRESESPPDGPRGSDCKARPPGGGAGLPSSAKHRSSRTLGEIPVDRLLSSQREVGFQILESFYRARFGGVAVSPDEAEGLARALESA